MDGLIIFLCVLCTIIYAFGTILHITTIHFLRQSSSTETPQKTLLLHFCSLEVAVLLMSQVKLYFSFVDTATNAYIMMLTFGAGWPWVHLLVVLTIDRFLRVYLNIKYDVHVTEQRKTTVISCCYLSGILILVFILLVHLM